jgi:hypothetical protein
MAVGEGRCDELVPEVAAVVVYEIEIPEWQLMQLTTDPFRRRDAWELIAEVTGRHVSARFCRMVVLARGADTLTSHELLERRSTRFTFEKAP